MYKSVLSTCTVALALASSGGAAHAGPLTAKTLGVAVSDIYLTFASPSAVVGAGVEFSFANVISEPGSVNFDENGLLVLSHTIPSGSTSYYGTKVTFTDLLDEIDDIVGITFLDVTGGVIRMDQANASFTANSVSISFDRTTWSGTSVVRFQLEFASPAAVPEPQTAAIALAALGLLALTRRRAT
jgi:MYXO-CTERM domain-containing protein